MGHSLRQRKFSSLGFPLIGTNVALTLVVVADTYLGVIVNVRF